MIDDPSTLLLGTGYVGEAFFRLHPNITATTRSETKRKRLLEIGPHVEIVDTSNIGSLELVLQHAKILIIAIAPGESSLAAYQKTYLESAKNICQILPKTVHHTIAISSTRVYRESGGHITTEQSPLDPEDPYANVLIETENAYLNQGSKVTILRLSGIYGPGRTLAEIYPKIAKNPKNPDSVTNMIHLDNILHCLEFIITSGREGIFNLSEDEHPTKRERYQKIALSHSLPPIQWEEPTTSWGKRISNQKIKDCGFKFKM